MMYSCQCSCGNTAFNINVKPLMRAKCHCTICQKYNEADFADVVVFRRKDIPEFVLGSIDFKTYKKPPAVQRGKCNTCKQPTLELFSMPLFPSLAMVPLQMFPAEASLPLPKMHMFYEHHVNEHIDDVPKHKGLISSQGGFMKYLFKALLTKD